MDAYPTCKICDRGTLAPTQIRRLSGPAVAIGYILLIPSIVGIAVCAMLIIAFAIAGPALAGSDHLLAVVLTGGGILAEIIAGVGCFVAGLIGWLLVMKKHALQCNNCGAVVDSAAPINSRSNWNTWRTVLLGFGMLLIVIAGAGVLAHNAENNSAQRAPDQSSPETAEPIPNISTTDAAKPTPDTSTAEPGQSDTMQPFTSPEGRFKVFFPSAPRQTSQTVHSKNGETGTIYDFIAAADNDKTAYVVAYTDSAPDVVTEGAQAHLQTAESAFTAGKTLLSDNVIDLDGVPGRAFTAADSQSNYIVREFLAGTRIYRLVVITPKGYTATQADEFMGSFSILNMPDQVGQCSVTSVKKIDTRLEGMPGSGSAIEFTNGGYQVSYDTLPAIEKSLVGDQVRLCLVSIPANCPAGDARGREYKTDNLRTGEAWTLPDSEHECGGA